jgi:uncharacterized membrane protein YfcA
VTSDRVDLRARWVMPVVALVVWLVWALAVPRDLPLHETWPLGVAMLLGSFIAGATSEGGGAIAFPVMTLLFAIPPMVARDFGLMCQTVGMGAAAIVIVARRTPIATDALRWALPAGVVGLAFGLRFVAPHLSGPAVKIFFCSLWAAFALAHVRASRLHDSAERVPATSRRWLGVAGFLGGIVSSLVGTGLDIVVFSVMVLRLGVSETVATPTSVVLMAVGSACGFALRALEGGPAPEAWAYWWTCVPVVVVGAPFGARFIEGRGRVFLSRLLYVSIVGQLVGALVLLPMTPSLLLFGAATFVVGVGVFLGVARTAPSVHASEVP